jgi:hypothetical protein
MYIQALQGFENSALILFIWSFINIYMEHKKEATNSFKFNAEFLNVRVPHQLLD